jgi:large subunit ribosomal protein L24
MSVKLKTGDKVKVIAGKDKGVESVVMKSFPKEHKVVVEKVAIAKKHQRPTRQNPSGSILSIEKPIDVSNVMVVCGKCHKPTKVAIKREGDKRQRVCKRCGAVIP